MFSRPVVCVAVAAAFSVAVAAVALGSPSAALGAKHTPTPSATSTPTAVPTPTTLKTYTVSASGSAGVAEAYCDVGDPVTGGGINGNLGGSTVAISVPAFDSVTGRAGWHGESFGAGPVITVAVCLDNAPSHLP